MTLKERAAALKQDIAAVFLALRAQKTPLPAKLLGWTVIVLALSPVDLIPDFIPVLGYLDDVIVLPALIALTLRLIPKDVLDDCRQQAKTLWPEGKPKKWRYALPTVAIWVLLIWFVAKKICGFFLHIS